MTPSRWRRVSELLNDTLEQPEAGQGDFLAEACGEDTALRREVESLLASHRSAGSKFEGPLFAAGAEAVSEPDPEQVGPYRIERLLGRGGMGSVYLALRADRTFEKKVALKILHGGLATEDLVRRFRSERQILAHLEHPNIARLLDGGTTDTGRPYLVMEYVEGRPINRYCDEEATSLAERLELFRKVCGAVHAAHQNLIVHRDLKPANILVQADGEPKLLDFGIAKLLRPQGQIHTLVATAQGLSPMTLSHASPEQVRGGTITTASDVYSLGVVLYQLLVARLPYEAQESDLQALATAICEQAPPRPSQALASAAEGRRWHRSLAGDLDTIVLKALQKEPRRRYASAEQLASDLDRYRHGLPVLARPDTFRYRTVKFLRRHRWPVAAAATAALLLLGLLLQLLLQRREIRLEQRSAEEVARVMIDVFGSSDPDRALGERLTARQLLDRGARQMAGRLADEPKVRANLLATFGEVYYKLGLLEEAEPLLEETLELRRSLYGPEDLRVAATLRLLADRDYFAGRYQRAEERYRAALGIAEESRQAASAEILQGLGLALQAQGSLEDSGSVLQRALSAARDEDGGDGLKVAAVLNVLGGLQRERGDLAAAEDSFRRALELYRCGYGELHPEVAGSFHNVAQVLNDSQHFDAAEELFRQALEVQRRLYEGPHPSLATTLDSLASSLFEQGRLEEAEPLAKEALEIRREVYGGEHARVARSLNLLGLIRAQQGRPEEAEALYWEAIAMWRRLHGLAHHDVAATLGNLGDLLAAQGRQGEAREHLEEALELTAAVYGAGHVRTAILTVSLAKVLKGQGDLTAAEELYRRALPLLERGLGGDHARVATLHQNLGVVLREQGRLPEAEEEMRRALGRFRTIYGNDHPYVAVTLKNLGGVLLAQSRPREAEPLAREALAIYTEIFDDDHPWVAAAREVLEKSLAGQR